MSSIDLNSKFKNHRAHEQALWSMLSLQQCMFALTGHLFTSGPVCLELFLWLFTLLAPSHLWSLNFSVTGPSFRDPSSIPDLSPHTEPCVLASELVSLSHTFYLVIYLFLCLAPPLECELCEERYLVCWEVHLCVLSTLNRHLVGR